MQLLRSLLVGGAMLTFVGVASAAEPVTLSDAQMDSVAAGALNDLNVKVGTGVGQIGVANAAVCRIGVGVVVIDGRPATVRPATGSNCCRVDASSLLSSVSAFTALLR